MLVVTAWLLPIPYFVPSSYHFTSQGRGRLFSFPMNVCVVSYNILAERSVLSRCTLLSIRLPVGGRNGTMVLRWIRGLHERRLVWGRTDFSEDAGFSIADYVFSEQMNKPSIFSAFQLDMLGYHISEPCCMRTMGIVENV